MKRIYGILICAVLLTGCTDGYMAGFNAYGDPHSVELYSGGKMVRSWSSTGKVQSEESSDGFYFMDSETKKQVRVTGDLVITPE